MPVANPYGCAALAGRDQCQLEFVSGERGAGILAGARLAAPHTSHTRTGAYLQHRHAARAWEDPKGCRNGAFQVYWEWARAKQAVGERRRPGSEKVQPGQALCVEI